MEFVDSGNFNTNRSANDNYWFRTREDAKAALIFLTTCWENDADARADDKARRELNDLIDASYDDDY